MKINEVKSRTLKENIKNKLVESKKLLKEGTGNFYYENVCLYVSDEDYESGNVPEIENNSINYSRNFPQYPLVDYNDNLRFYNIVLTPGYYEGACIDYVEIDDNEVYSDILYDAEHNIDGYAFEDGKWTFQDVFMRHQDEEPKEVSEEEVIADIRNWVFKDYSVVTDEDIKQAIERYKKDGYYALSSFLVDSSIIDKIEEDLAKKELEVVKERIEQIKEDYGYRELQTVARFSNGETIYDFKESLIEKFGEFTYEIPVDVYLPEFETYDPIMEIQNIYDDMGIKVKFTGMGKTNDGQDEMYVQGTVGELVKFLYKFSGLGEDDSLDYIYEFGTKIEGESSLKEAEGEDTDKYPNTTMSGNRYKKDDLTGIVDKKVVVKFPAFEMTYHVKPGTQYMKHDDWWSQDTYGDLTADKESLEALDKMFKNTIKQEIKAQGIKGIPEIGTSRLVPVPDEVHLRVESGRAVENLKYKKKK
jgi:hypothetical protein